MTLEADRHSPAYWDARYRENHTPWDQGTVAPEVLAFVAEHPGEGRWALDIGCGTGTHSRELARHGYRVVGLDLSWVALRRALMAARRESLPWYGVQADAVELGLLQAAFAVALDIGCFHGLTAGQQRRYAAGLALRLEPGGFYLLYALHPAPDAAGGPPGVGPEQVEAVFRPFLERVDYKPGWQGDRRADWWLWQRRQTFGRSPK
jgi:SAM-dependent methyltransferase